METLTKDSTSTPSTFAERAAALQARGFSLIPLASRGKQPVAGLGVRSRTKDPERIAQWAEQFPDANVGVCADDTFIILDADNAEEMLKVTGQLNTYTVESSPGKAHYYFKRDPQGFNYVRNLELGKAGSLRASNQYVVSAGSIHPKTGLEYRVINDAPIAIIDPGMFDKLERAAKEVERETQRIIADWDGHSQIPEGMRHGFLVGQAGRLHNGNRSEEELAAELMSLCERFCPGQRQIVESEVDRIAAWVIVREPNTAAQPYIISGPRRERDGFVFAPFEGEEDGLFPIGELSLIYGSSGAGKTTLGIQMMIAQANREKFFGRESFGFRFVVVLQDRSPKALRRTLKRMHVPDLPVETLKGNPAECIQQAILKHSHPEVVFFEGADMAMEGDKALSIGAVNKFVDELRTMAEHHGVALVATVGSPKLKIREAYRNPRDMAFGSSGWSRKSETIIGIQEDYETGVRSVRVMPRNAKPTEHSMEFHEGRLREKAQFAEIDRSPGESFSPLAVYREWWNRHPLAGVEETMKAFGISKATLMRWRQTIKARQVSRGLTEVRSHETALSGNQT